MSVAGDRVLTRASRNPWFEGLRPPEGVIAVLLAFRHIEERREE
jgi:hypothetical protein